MFSELIQGVPNHEPKDTTDPLNIFIYVQELSMPAISSKAIWYANKNSQKL